MKKLFPLIIAFIYFSSCSNEKNWIIESPDGNIVATIFLSEDKQVMYTVDLNTDEGIIAAIKPSALGVVREDADLSSGLSFLTDIGRFVSQSYQLPAGKRRSISYEANERTLVWENNEGVRIKTIFRVFNDGIAFRYQFPGDSDDLFTINKENTSFNIPENGKCWGAPYDSISKWTPAYEKYYTRIMDIGTDAPADLNGWAFPMTFNTNNLWILITESNLDGSYPASHLQPNCENGVYSIRFPEKSEALGKFSNKPISKLPWYSPWRVAIIGTSAGTIVESTMVTDLAEPSEIEDVSWIKPGRAAWSWWSDSPSPQYVKEQNRFTDLAVEMGWEYNLIDANWDNMKDGVVTDAINYANEKGIGAILWYNSGGSHNSVEEAPRDKMWDPELRAKEFKMLAEWGVKGVKVDFFQSDKQEIIKQYLGILKDAAENKILVNFHGCTLPRGWNRTWPNMLTLESVPGGEVYKFYEPYPEIATWHNTVLPFTRNAVGPMDYTPVMFSDHTYPHLTTYAHELATSVIFESGIIHMADKVEAYQRLPEIAKQFLKDVPAAWDDIKYIDGYPGEYIILARRNGDTWYIAGLNGGDKKREFKLNTSFLGEDAYTIHLISDGQNDQKFKFKDIAFKAGEELSIQSLPYGGFAGIISAE